MINRSVYEPDCRVEVLKTRVFKAGYIVRTEKVLMPGNPDVTLNVAYTLEGSYIGNSKDAHFLVQKRGIKPELRTGTSKTCSIGFCEKEQKWYGWSHRAIFDFGIGDTVKEGDLTSEELEVGFTARTLEDAKKMAMAFAESVS